MIFLLFFSDTRILSRVNRKYKQIFDSHTGFVVENIAAKQEFLRQMGASQMGKSNGGKRSAVPSQLMCLRFPAGSAGWGMRVDDPLTALPLRITCCGPTAGHGFSIAGGRNQPVASRCGCRVR
jgi:hypothetical protein